MQGEFVYVTADGRFFLHGDLYDSSSRRNLTEISRQEDRLEVMDPIDPETLIVFAPADPKAGTASWTGIARALSPTSTTQRFRARNSLIYSSRVQKVGTTRCRKGWGAVG